LASHVAQNEIPLPIYLLSFFIPGFLGVTPVAIIIDLALISFC